MRWFVSLLAAAFLLLLPVSGAAGHAGLTSSNPADGTELAVAPEEVTLTFSEELFNELVEVSILDSAGDLVMATEAEQTPPPGTDVIVPWPADLPAGKYSVAFRVVSEDGHPVTGQVTFSYTDVATPTVEPTVEPTPAAEPESTPQTPQTSEATDTEPSPELIAAEDAGQPNNSLIGPLLIAGAVIVGLGVVISVIMLARARQ
jgi:methionine-rich copper-binding protein CopC